MEECWYINKHGKIGEEPLECLECKRMKGKTLMDKPEDPVFSAFIDGYRFAMLEIASYGNQEEHRLSQFHQDLFIGLYLKFLCSIDRGISLKQLRYGLQQITLPLLKDLLEGKSPNSDNRGENC